MLLGYIPPRTIRRNTEHVPTCKPAPILLCNLFRSRTFLKRNNLRTSRKLFLLSTGTSRNLFRPCSESLFHALFNPITLARFLGIRESFKRVPFSSVPSSVLLCSFLSFRSLFLDISTSILCSECSFRAWLICSALVPRRFQFPQPRTT